MYRWWRTCVLLLVAAGFASFLAGVVNNAAQGTFGMTIPGRLALTVPQVITAIEPDSPAARAGMRAGDTVRIAPSFANQVVLYATVPGDRLTIAHGARAATLVASESKSAPSSAFIAVVEFARLTFLAMAALIAWRRPDDPAARALAVFLACFGVGITFDPATFPWVFTRFVLLLLLQTLFLIGALAALAFSVRFPAVANGGFRAALDRRMPALGVTGIALSVLTICAIFTVPLSTTRERSLIALPFLLFYIAVILSTFVALIEGLRTSTGGQRVRARWALDTIVLGLSGLLVFLLADAGGNGPQALQYLVLTTLVIPFGLAYAIFRHRMLDITFVINRAVVYTCVSAVIVGSFIFFEWLLGLVVEQNSRASIVLQLLAALALGVSTRFIHARVDRFIDNLFFRERHAAEAAVRRFAHEAGLITTIADLTTKTVDVAQRNMHLSGAAFYALSDDAFAPLHSTIPAAAPIDENDYAILEMRTWHAAVEPDLRGSGLRGDVAFPMIVRGTLTGFLLCAEKDTHEALAPDERDALSVLAGSAGVALDSLRVRRLERQLKELSEDASIPQPARAMLSDLSARRTNGLY